MAKHGGDTGTTLNYKGERIPKDDQLIMITGKFDDFLAGLDLAKLHLKDPVQKEWIDTIAKKMWQTAGEVSLGGLGKNVLDYITNSDLETLEEWMNSLTPLPKAFIRFTKPAPVYLNEARVRCRDLERELTSYLRDKDLRPEIYAYINRLSLFLFHLAFHNESSSS